MGFFLGGLKLGSLDHTSYLMWQSMAYGDQRYLRKCEEMVKRLCHASLLKGNDSRLRRAPFCSRCHILCDDAAYESTNYTVMQCPFNEGKREIMFKEIDAIYPDLDAEDNFSVLMGKPIEGCDPERTVQIWSMCNDVTLSHICM